MKTKFVIVLVAQTLLILALLAFSLFQRAEAEKQRALAIELAERATEERFKAETIRMQLDSLKRIHRQP